MWWRIAAGLAIFGLIELVDSNIDKINFPWWLSLIIAFFLSVGDIILVMIVDYLND